MSKKEAAKQQNVMPPKSIDDLRTSFADIEKWHEDDPEWDEITQLEWNAYNVDFKH